MLLAALPALASARPQAAQPPGQMVEVVVELASPSAARSRLPRSHARLDLGSHAALHRLTRIRAEQEQVAGRIADALPEARIRWRYRIVLNGLAVVLPARAVPRLERVDGVTAVHESSRYRAQLDRSPTAIGAPTLWGPGLSTAGQGVKIAIIDDGIDQRHPFFDPTGYAMPAGFPKGQAAYTTGKVIAARSFPPPSPRARFAELPLDPAESEHGTHVAGIAAGNNGTPVQIGGGQARLSGVAPRAYLGNYRVLTIPTAANVGLDGNSPEIAAAIEAAVQDGMDVINLSIGEPEIAPSRDLVVRAIEGAARAGVVTAVSAGNDHDAFGRGSVSSPGSASSAITVGATTIDRRMAGFSAAGPTPVSLRLKPEVSAPGVNIISAAPARKNLWQELSGTSMAAPHVAGAAALLLERHPTWTPAQVKSALVSTGRTATDGSHEASPSRQGGGSVDLPRADQPLIFTAPSAVSFGFVRLGRSVVRRVSLSDAGGGAGEWTLSAALQGRPAGIRLDVASRASVPGAVQVRVSTPRTGRGAEFSGFLVLRRGADTRRVPFWGRLTAPRLARQPARRLIRTGTYRGNTRGRRALVTAYRYPENPTGSGVDRILRGPEQVFRVRLRRPAENFGVTILSRRGSARVQPRIVVGKDENRLAGPTALPLNTNPYLPTFFERVPTVSVLRPTAGTYHVVFDSTTSAGAGRFSFRFWIDDRRPPQVRIVGRSVRSGGTLVFRASDAGAGIDPGTIFASVAGSSRTPTYSSNGNRMTITVPVGRLPSGRHRVVLQVSDRQEAKNMENALRILPNTRVLATTITVR
ncbi:MAG TPA: S8 family serine peptidase [Gaiellaceae bacterium]|nr:S8 family serine peptidase [Gaiellaceae bacterium]